MSILDPILRALAPYLSDTPGRDGDVVLATRLRLARNLSPMPFPISSTAVQALDARDQIKQALQETELSDKNAFYFNLESLNQVEQKLLLERRLLSPAMLVPRPGQGVAISSDQSCVCMIGEEDAIRLQVILPDFSPLQVYKRASELDDSLSQTLELAFDEKLGFLTCCPTNLGTGMRLSVMLHLGALSLTGEINQAIHAVTQMGMTVRGTFGEGSGYVGSLYQLSNQSTLGENELQIVDRVERVTRQLICCERNARAVLAEKTPTKLLDTIGRAYGTLSHAYSISGTEALNELSKLRFGVEMNLFTTVDRALINRLQLLIGEAHLQDHLHQVIPSAPERDIRRAAMLRAALFER